jgi:hypothetical protein
MGCPSKHLPAGPGSCSDGRRRIVFQIWDWIDERRHVVHLYVTQEALDGWTVRHFAGKYRSMSTSRVKGSCRNLGRSNNWPGQQRLGPDREGEELCNIEQTGRLASFTMTVGWYAR